MSNQDPLIHIGYHKTASTWLQNNLLDNSNAGFKRYLEFKDVENYIVLPNSLDFDSSQAKEYYETLANNNSNSGIMPVISNERLSGNPHSGGYDSKEIADRLYKIFPNSKILIIIREQKSIINSCYLQYVKIGGTCSIKDYLEPPQKNLPVIPLFSFNHFNYLRLVNYYLKLFGKENVLVLPYELFKENANTFCSKIVNFSNAKKTESLPYSKVVNKRISAFSSTILRQYNKAFAKTTLNPSAINLKNKDHSLKSQATTLQPRRLYNMALSFDKLVPRPVLSFFDKRLKGIIEEKVQGRYKESNQELSKIINIDLSKYGYDM